LVITHVSSWYQLGNFIKDGVRRWRGHINPHYTHLKDSKTAWTWGLSKTDARNFRSLKYL